MKIITAISVISFIAMSFFCIPANSLTAIEVKKIYEESNLVFDNVLIGDSITYMGPWTDLLNCKNIGNRGVGGDTTKGLLQRMNTILATNPKKVFIMLGINDSYQERETVDSIFLNYKKIVDLLINNNISVVITSTVSCNRALSEKCKQALPKIVGLNKHIKTLTESYNIPFLDLNSLLSGKDGLDKKFTSDGVHLNLDAYKIWRDLLSPFVLGQ